jgi:hypothetical protein
MVKIPGTKANSSKYACEKIPEHQSLTVPKTAIPVISALTAIVAALVVSTALLGRPVGLWGLILCGTGGVVLAFIILKFRKRQERRHLDSIRDSALW